MGRWSRVTLHGLRATLSSLSYLFLGRSITVRQHAKRVVGIYRLRDASEHYMAGSLSLLDEAPAFSGFAHPCCQSSCYKLQSNVQHRHSRYGNHTTQHEIFPTERSKQFPHSIFPIENPGRLTFQAMRLDPS